VFKKRFKEFLLYLFGIPTFFAVMIGIIYLILTYTPLDKWLTIFAQKYSIWTMGLFLLGMILYSLWKFINWLFIEPYRASKKEE
jgi:hypothetical protein